MRGPHPSIDTRSSAPFRQSRPFFLSLLLLFASACDTHCSFSSCLFAFSFSPSVLFVHITFQRLTPPHDDPVLARCMATTTSYFISPNLVSQLLSSLLFILRLKLTISFHADMYPPVAYGFNMAFPSSYAWFWPEPTSENLNKDKAASTTLRHNPHDRWHC